MSARFGIIDLFAGPGGLGEGFTAFETDGRAPFHIGISVEKDASAHRTLTLRAFLRACRAQSGRMPQAYVDFHADRITEPDWATIDACAWQQATAEARRLELGTPDAAEAVDGAIHALGRDFDDTVLIGGPPCQAYSLVGRARSRGNAGYVPEEDARHYLFREYIRVLARLEPAAFVMENVKGMLSSTVESRLVFEMLMEDLASLGQRRGHRYELRAIHVEDGMARLREYTSPADFIVRAEAFGIPQRRHRVIIIGIRADLARQAEGVKIKVPATTRTVDDVIGTLPALRSGLSRAKDSAEAWQGEVLAAAERLSDIPSDVDAALRRAFHDLAQRAHDLPARRSASTLPHGYGASDDGLMRWLERPGLEAIAQHQTRGHMAADLERYLFAATYGRLLRTSPKAADFPLALSPDHRSWHRGVFSDRFRVQLAHEPATTVTSHISKDGHYFIHPEPLQCRSLTVREAARLQTFPDDYLFLGPRTNQYVQVGNAVPPLLSRYIAALIHAALTGNSSAVR